MKVIRKDEQVTHQGTTFTGPAQVTPILPAQPGSGLRVTLVSFEAGAVTHWHEHPGEQILYILSGEGRVSNGHEEFRVSAGDVIHAGPGEKHWHGAAPDCLMSHLSVTTVGPPLWYDEAPEL